MLPNSQIIHLQKNTGESYRFEMIEVVGGIFRMRDDKSSGFWTEKEKPEHEVHVPTFWMGKFPVVQSLYEFVMGENPSYFKGDNRPVESVSWQDCKTFIEKLNALSGKNFQLPSEAEWEYAARGGVHWRDKYKYSGGNELDKYGWYDENSHRETKPVGLKLPNKLGLYDMSGNVREWCEDDWHENYEGAPDDGSAWVGKEETTSAEEESRKIEDLEANEKVESLDLEEAEENQTEEVGLENVNFDDLDLEDLNVEGIDFDDLDLEDFDEEDIDFDDIDIGVLDLNLKLVRGGSWINYTNFCRVAYRGSSNASLSAPYIGLRLALPQF